MKLRLWLIIPVILGLVACEKNKDPESNYGEVSIKIEHVWGPVNGASGTSQEFKKNTVYTHGETAEEIQISNLQYYVSNIELKNTEGKWVKENYSYHLVTAEDGKEFKLVFDSVPVADYTDVRFVLGVDSAMNVSGAQDGALSTANNMFWSWNTGYIFLKAEGMSDQVNDPSTKHFMYHIGGFTKADGKDATSSKELSFNGSLLSVEKDASAMIHCVMNVAEIWNADVKLSELHKVHMPGMKAVKVAKNFNDCFTVHHVHN